MRKISRLVGVVMAATAITLAAGCTGSDKDGGGDKPAALEKVTYLTGAGILGFESYMYVAIDKGYFKDAGLEVEVKPGSGTLQNLKVLQAGQVDFAIVDISAALIEYGKTGSTLKDFTVVSAIQQRNLSCIMALAGHNINSPKDLAGKKIAFIPGGVVKTLFGTYARLAGVNDSKINWVQMPVAQMGPNLASGSIDAATQFVVSRPYIEATTKAKAVVLPFSDYMTDLYGNGLAVTKKAIADNPDRVKRFNTAMLKGLQFAVDNPSEAGKIFAKYQKLEPAVVAAAETELMVPYARSSASGAPVGALDPQRVARNIAIIQGANVISNSIKPEDVVSFQFAPKS